MLPPLVQAASMGFESQLYRASASPDPPMSEALKVVVLLENQELLALFALPEGLVLSTLNSAGEEYPRSPASFNAVAHIHT